MDIFIILNVVIGIVAAVGVPAVGLLFKQFASIKEDMNAQAEEFHKLELMIAREYVSQVALEKIMAPIIKDVNNLERMIERIDTKLAIPAVHEE